MSITVVVDDTDPAIVYHGPWTTVGSGSSFLNQSIGQSLHNSSGDSTVGGVQDISQFLYSFTGKVEWKIVVRVFDILSLYMIGTSIGLFALMTPELVQGAKPPYVWSCSIIGAATNMTPVVLSSLSGPTLLKICFQDGLEENEYEFEFSTSVGGIFIDHLEYLPPPSPAAMTYSYIGVNANDPGIQYTNETWFVDTTNDGTSGRAQSGNSALLYEFTGVYRYSVLDLIKNRMLIFVYSFRICNYLDRHDDFFNIWQWLFLD